MSQVYEISGALYTPQGKQMVTVEVNWVTGSISFFDPSEKENANSRINYDISFQKRGWILTDFLCKHREKPITYKLTFTNPIGDNVKALLDAASNEF